MKTFKDTVSTLQQYNNSRLTSKDILTGRQHRNLKRKNKLKKFGRLN